MVKILSYINLSCRPKGYTEPYHQPLYIGDGNAREVSRLQPKSSETTTIGIRVVV